MDERVVIRKRTRSSSKCDDDGERESKKIKNVRFKVTQDIFSNR